jgi:hypothetical protein
VGFIKAVLMNVMTAAAEFEKGSLRLQYFGEDVLVAEIAK